MFGKEKDKSDVIDTLPMVPMLGLVVFPHMMIPFVIGRPSSIKALEYALVKGKRIFLSAQPDATRDNPSPEEIYTLGTICNIVQSLKLPDGNVKVLVEGLDRGRALEFKEESGFLKVVAKVVPRQVEAGSGIETMMSKTIALFEQYVKLSNNLHYDAMLAAVRVEEPGKLADTIASHLVIPVDEKQNLLEIFSPQERLGRIAQILEGEVDKLNVDKRIQGRVKKQMERAQKEYYLNEKMKAIQKELGRKDDRVNEVEELRKRIEQARIVEFLAVRQLVKEPKGPILCFVGPPGVGKTSLAKSIARCTNRKFVRMSLGGVRDEAEIRGHRRTYIGAFPGQIVQMMKKAGTRNPVFLLDEVDKMSMDFRGDPSAALLEVLDPEQNHSFTDHYLDVEFDLSSVFFIATANVLHTIPQPLQDRMEVLRLPGYTEREKVEIAKRHLTLKQVKSHGLRPENVSFTDDALQEIIRRYTREAGVRNMEREISSICRKVARKVVLDGRGYQVEIGADNVTTHLGIPRYRTSRQEERNEIGMATGLAWTEVGGEILPIEVMLMPGKGALRLTGKLGDVMQESAHAALSYVRSRAEQLGIVPGFNRRTDIHIHVPEGAIPKDGPSAGITIATALVSALTKIPVRREVAMTGEITLRGKVLPIGGVKEKLLAAHRIGMTTIVLPRENEKDLADIPKVVLDAVAVELVEHQEEVLKIGHARPVPPP